MDRIARIRSRLATLNPETVEITDDGHKHVGHAGAADGRGHFSVTIVAAIFEGLSLLQRHRLVYDAVGDLMESDIHALSIRALSPGESGG